MVARDSPKKTKIQLVFNYEGALALAVTNLVIAMGAGALIFSHLNDGGFWFVKEYFNMTVPQTLKTWSVVTTIQSVVALLLVLLLNALLK